MTYLDKAEQIVQALNNGQGKTRRRSLFNKKSNGGLVTFSFNELLLLEFIAKEEFRAFPEPLGDVYAGGITERKNFRPFALFHPIVTEGIHKNERVKMKVFSVVIPTKRAYVKNNVPPVVYLTGRSIEENDVAFVHEWVVRYFYEGEYVYTRLPFVRKSKEGNIEFSGSLHGAPILTVNKANKMYQDKKEVQII